MKITRRFFLLLTLSVTFLSSTQAQTKSYTAYVGTYTDKTGSKGIYAFSYDPATGKLADQRLVAESSNPSWVILHPNGKFAYAANESGKQSMVSAFSIDAKTGNFTALNQVPAGGEDPCHLAIDKTGKYLFAANYTSGNVSVFPILPDGKLGEPTAVVKDAGTPGPNKERQEAPHAHWVQTSSDNRFVFVVDLGLDEILVYRFNDKKGTLAPNDPPFAKPAPGAGPRHAVFSPNGRFLYVVSELNSTVTAFSYDAKKGSFQLLDSVPMLPAGFQGRNEPAEIAIHSSGKWLFASNRGHDTIAVFAIDPASGKLAPAGEYPIGGKEPRHFALDPSGNFLLTEDQNTNAIVTFRIDRKTGALTESSRADNIPAPVCLAFYRVH